jgi:hypothetical protein
MHSEVLRPARAGAFLLLAACACSAPAPLGERVQAVAGGEETGNERGAVVYVTAELGTVAGASLFKAGSGSVLAPNLVVTALHVISRNRSDIPFTCDATGHEVTGSKGSELGTTVEPERVAIFAGPVPGDEPVARGAKIVSSGSTTICQNDIAFIVLDRPIDLPSMPVYRGAPAELGEELIAIGFGGEDASQSPIRTERAVTVTAVGQWIRTFTVSEGPCEGDSGGPTINAAGQVAGVFSTVSLDCTSESAAAKYTDLSYFSPLLEEAFLAADAGDPFAGEGGEGGAPPVSPTEAGAPPIVRETPLNDPEDSGCALAARGAGPRGWWLVAAGLTLLARCVRKCGGRRPARLAQHSAQLV